MNIVKTLKNIQNEVNVKECFLMGCAFASGLACSYLCDSYSAKKEK